MSARTLSGMQSGLAAGPVLLTTLITVLAGCSAPGVAPPASSTVTASSLKSCSELPAAFRFPDTALSAASEVPAGTLSVAGTPIGAHCLVTGAMHERVSPVDGQTYRIGFEMRLPREWNGRFLYQGNGGMDGVVAPAVGAVGGGGVLTNALAQGFAVISSDAGHSPQQNPLFGLDPQARLDYGYQAVGKLTPMAKALIREAYQRPPDRSYIGGCSNGGRHALVAAARHADQYDGFLAGNPGFNLPQAALAQLYGAQQFARVASGDLAGAFTEGERKWFAGEVLKQCDALDGLADGIVSATARCQNVFRIRGVATCAAGTRTGQCITELQREAIGNVFRGAHDSSGRRLYATFPYDAGIGGSDWASWKFMASVRLDPVAMAFVFQTPPAPADVLKDPRAFAMGFDVTRDGGKIFASEAPYTESSMSFMTPPDADRLTTLRRRGKLLVYHGTSDPVFSSDDTAAWYDRLRAANGGNTDDFARYFPVPGMNHCQGGPATDQFDMLTALIDWVEKGVAPDSVVATARGAGNRGGVNAELPPDWAPDRTRLLCPSPRVAMYKGGDSERATSFRCE